MKKEEAMARGVAVSETKHSMKRRGNWHDYNRCGTYMLTLVVTGRKPLLGSLHGGEQQAWVSLSLLGSIIMDDEVGKIGLYYPQVEVWKVCVMPEHIHLIVNVRENLSTGKHLGHVVAGFKGGCSRVWQRLRAGSDAPATVPPASSATPPSASATVPSASTEGSLSPVPTTPFIPLFERGYNDKILLDDGQLERWKAYLDENPLRLMLKRLHPDAFTVLHGMEIAGRRCQIVGNRFLLDIPDKVAVIVHRRYSDAENARLRATWLACGERGGVLVSAAISPKEKEVLREAMNRGYRIILLRENGFPELYKPSGESFYNCVAGLLLQVSPFDYHMEHRTITREQCLLLNDMAEQIAR